MEEPEDDRTYTWVELRAMSSGDLIELLHERPDVFEELPDVNGKKKVYDYLKKQSPHPEHKEAFKWLIAYMKEDIEGSRADSLEQGIVAMTEATTGEELGAAATVLVAQLEEQDIEGDLTADQRTMVSYLNDEIQRITNIVDRNNYQTGRRMAFRQVRAFILGESE